MRSVRRTWDKRTRALHVCCLKKCSRLEHEADPLCPRARPSTHRAGDSDACLTDGGENQVQLLARHFRDRVIRFTRVFSSDLDRASRTAEGVCQHQLGGDLLAPLQLSALREQQFSSTLEGTRWRSGASASSISSPDALRGGEPTYTDEEPLESMKARAEAFLREQILPLMLETPGQEEVVAVVAHGVILQVLWLCLTALFNPQDIQYGPEVDKSHLGDHITPVWSNTGYMELDIKQWANAPQMSSRGTSAPLMLTGTYPVPNRQGLGSGAPLSGWTMTVLAVDEIKHLITNDLDRTGGTVRNPVHQSRQHSMDQFYRLVGTT